MSDGIRLPLARLPPAPVVVTPGDRSAVISLQERLIERALETGASDLHIEPRHDQLRIRLRIDGWLHDTEPLPIWLHASLVARFKVLGDMDVAERRRPQDGRASVARRLGSVDLRIATLPTQHGEKVVVRLLPHRRRPPDLRSLGLDDDALGVLASFADAAHGLLLAAGPTGAGKTTTLYALLRRIDAVGRHVVTLEDPIEYVLPDVVQVPIRRRAGVDFASALRAVLRQDPDVILLGEIRDDETARIAVRAAITGHLVLSTVHTNSAVESVGRLLDLGVPAHLLAASLIGIVSQRLVRRLCHACRIPDEPEPEMLAALALPASPDDLQIEGDVADTSEPSRYWRGTGCSRCRGGYRDRIGLFETLTLDPTLRQLIASGGDPLSLERAALNAGCLRTLGESARAAVEHAVTSVDEAARVARYVP